MRPTDENQYGSTRPNLMSSGIRRGGGEDNILDMLERNSERGRYGAAPRVALYGCAGATILVLIGALAWLLHENQSASDAMRAVEQAVVPIPEPPAAAAPASALAGIAPQGLQFGLPSAHAATIVDNPEPALHAAQPATPAAAQVAKAEPPPLVLLSPEEAASARSARPERASAARPQPVREAPPARELPVAQADRAALAANPAARPRAPSVALPAPKAVARATPAKLKKPQPAPAVPTSEAPADNDVALISAIISHSSRHSAERTQADAGAACGAGGDKKCAPRPVSEP